MKRSMKRKAFTIVEMVIVIAVIAILAAVMIPTISGMIQKANVSADTQFAASLNIQLALWKVDNDEIATESDLRDAINEYYGEWEDEEKTILAEGGDFFATLAPKSGKYGYHYWYDVENQQVVLSTYEKLGETTTLQENPDNVTLSAVPLSGGQSRTFAESSPRTITKDGKSYYLMDRAGSEEIVELNKLETIELTDAGVYGQILANLKKFGEEDSLYAEIWNKLQHTAIANNYGIFAASEGEMEYLHIPVTATQLNGTPRVPNGDTVDLTKVISVDLPAGVKVGSFALLGLSDDITIYTSVNDTLEDIKKHFYENSVDCYIQLSNGNKIKLSDYELDPSQTLESFELSATTGGKYQFMSLGNGKYQLYVAENSTDTITLSLSNIMGKDKDGKVSEMYATGATFAVPGTAKGITSVQDSSKNTATLTINSDIAKNSEAFNITVGLLNESCTLTVEVVTIKRVYVDYGAYSTNLNILVGNATGNVTSGNENLAEMILTLPYESANDTWAFIPSYEASNTASVGFNAKDISVSVSGDYLEYDAANGQFKLKSLPAGNHQETLTLAYCGETATYTIRLVKKTSSAFAIDSRANTAATYKTTDANGNSVPLVYTVGTQNAFNLNYLFDIKGDADATTIDGGKTFYVDILNASGTSYISGKSIECDSLDDTLQLPASLAGQTVIIRISTDNMNSANYVDLKVNVVNGTNVTSQATWEAASGNIVLLTDLKNFEDGTGRITVTNATVYGNLHKIYWDDGNEYNVTGSDGDHAIITLNNGVVDNLIIDGPNYTKTSLYSEGDTSGVYVFGVYANGTATINNSYISGFMAPVGAKKASSTVNLTSTVLKGGAMGNIYVNQSGITLNISNCTMIRNFEGSLAAPGIYLDEKCTSTAINMSGTEQYTFATESQAKTLPGVSSMGSTVAGLIVDAVNNSVGTHKIGTTTYVHMGVLMHASATVNGWSNNSTYQINGETYKYTEQKINSLGAKACVVQGDATLTCTKTSIFHSHGDSCYSWNCSHTLAPTWGSSAADYLDNHRK